jgi:hypothetical protein
LSPRTLDDFSNFDMELGNSNNLLVWMRAVERRLTAVMRGLDTRHAERHATGGADELDLTGLSGLSATQQTPASHHTRHENGGDDEIDVTGLTGLPAPTTVFYPKRATLWADEALILVGSGLAADYLAAQQYATYTYLTSDANGDSCSWGLLLAAGTYSFAVLGLKQTVGAKADWYVDGAAFATGQDWYHAGGNALNIVFTVTNVVVATSGWHVVKYIINGRNGGNTTGYRVPLTKLWLVPSAD